MRFANKLSIIDSIDILRNEKCPYRRMNDCNVCEQSKECNASETILDFVQYDMYKYLQNEKEKFCRWKCKKYGFNSITREYLKGSFETKVCHYKEDINLCEYCQLDNFINEIQDTIQLKNNG